MDISWTQISLTAVTVIFSAGSAWGALLVTLRHLKSRVKELEGKLKEQGDAEDVRKTHYDDVSDELGDQLQRLEQKIANLEVDYKHRCQELADIKKRVSSDELASTGAHKRVDGIEEVLRGMQKEISDSKQQLALLKDGIALRLEYLGKAENAVTELSLSMQDLKTRVDRNEHDIQRQGQILDSHTLKITRIEARGGS